MNTAVHAYQLTDQVKLLQKVALIHDEHILLVKRAPDAKSRPEKWDLPGGNSEWPETTESGHGQYALDAVREVREETGIELGPELFTEPALRYLDTYFDAQHQIFSIIFGWSIALEDATQPDVVLSDEHTDYAWVTLDELDQYDFDQKGEFVALTARRALAHGRL